MAERICAKFTEKSSLVPRSEEFECQGQRSKINVTDKKRKSAAFFGSGPRGLCVRCMFGKTSLALVTFRVRRSQGEMYIGHKTAICVSVCLSLAAFPHYCTDPDVTSGNGRGVL